MEGGREVRKGVEEGKERRKGLTEGREFSSKNWQKESMLAPAMN